MQIVCTTEEAAIGVLRIMLATRLLPRRDYEISLTLPTTYTVRSVMPAARPAQIHTVADTLVRTIA